jgi:hypothetical protein
MVSKIIGPIVKKKKKLNSQFETQQAIININGKA